MAEDVEIPKVGRVPKKVLIPIVVGAGGFVVWKYYTARNSVGEGEVPEDLGFEDPGVLPPVAGAVKPGNEYGEGSAPPSADDFGFTGHSNDEWTQYATVQLSQSDRWSYADIVTALGNYLDHKPLTTLHQDIARAAIAVAGPPPVGTFVIVSGGNTAITVAPSGVKLSATANTVTATFNSVAGAQTYYVYVSGSNRQVVGSRSPVTVTGLTPNTSYSVQVAAVSASGQVGPRSSAVSIRTAGVKLATPAKPSVSSITKNSAVVKTNPVANATGYNWHINGAERAHTDAPILTMTRLTSRALYTVKVAADASYSAPSPYSSSVQFRTK